MRERLKAGDRVRCSKTYMYGTMFEWKMGVVESKSKDHRRYWNVQVPMDDGVESWFESWPFHRNALTKVTQYHTMHS